MFLYKRKSKREWKTTFKPQKLSVTVSAVTGRWSLLANALSYACGHHRPVGISTLCSLPQLLSLLSVKAWEHSLNHKLVFASLFPCSFLSHSFFLSCITIYHLHYLYVVVAKKKKNRKLHKKILQVSFRRGARYCTGCGGEGAFLSLL